MRTCIKCCEEKEVLQFQWSKQNNNICKSCHAVQMRPINEKARKKRQGDPVYKENCRIRRNLNRAKLRTEIDRIKTKPCTDCGKSFHPYVMDFDHVRGEKKECVGVMCADGRPLKRVLDEIAKCDLVCANCHRMRTLNRGFYKKKKGNLS